MKLEDFDFQNIFELLGIEHCDDLDYLRSIISNSAELFRNNQISAFNDRIEKITSNNSDNKNEFAALVDKEKKEGLSQEEIDRKDEIDKILKKSDNEISACNDQIKITNDNIDKIIEVADSCNNPNKLLRTYLTTENFRVNLSKNNGKDLTEGEKNYNSLIKLANITFKDDNSIKEYLHEQELYKENIDFNDHDLSRFKFSKPDYDKRSEISYEIKSNWVPNVIMNETLDNGDELKVYNLGDFSYGMFLTKEKEPTKSTEFYPLSLLTVDIVHSDETKERHNVAMHLNEIDMKDNKDFYSNVVFSPMVMRNAEKNNSGYVGDVILTNQNGDLVTRDDGTCKRELIFNAIDAQDNVSALSYAELNKGKIHASGCLNINDFYKRMNSAIDIQYKYKKSMDDSGNSGNER